MDQGSDLRFLGAGLPGRAASGVPGASVGGYTSEADALVRQDRPQAVVDLIYRPYRREAFRLNLFLALRTTGDPAAMAAAVQGSIWRLGPEVPVLRV